MRRTARGETRENFVCACNDREIHCFDKRRLDFSLDESIDAFASPPFDLVYSKFNLYFMMVLRGSIPRKKITRL